MAKFFKKVFLVAFLLVACVGVVWSFVNIFVHWGTMTAMSWAVATGASSLATYAAIAMLDAVNKK